MNANAFERKLEKKVIDLEDDGFIDLRIGNVSRTLDLYKVNNDLVDMARSVEGGEPEDVPFIEKVINYIENLGFFRVSQRVATLFITKIYATVDDLKKKDELGTSPLMNADSQNSTDSQSLD